MLTRRGFLAAGAAVAASPAWGVDPPGPRSMLRLRELPGPVTIEQVQRLQTPAGGLVRVIAGGEAGVVKANSRLGVAPGMLDRLVTPYFVGKDARDLERLVDGVYFDRDSRGSVYKFAGMPFWNAIAHVEAACFDLLGRRAGVSAAELLGGRRRETVDVYISQFGRETTAEQEVDTALRDLHRTAARATKLKVGLRMRNSAAQAKRDRQMVRLFRGRAPDVTLYVDANGSYRPDEAIEMGRFLDDHGVTLFEEPVPWEDQAGTASVTAALRDRAIAVAGGEQDSSLWTWQAMAAERRLDVLQPDVMYNGGLIRCLRVAKMAAVAGLPVTPHCPKALPEAAATRQLLAVVEGLGPFQEARSFGRVKDGRVELPDGPGLGVDHAAYRLGEATVLS